MSPAKAMSNDKELGARPTVATWSSSSTSRAAR
jgi:hypothetical protein